MSDAPVSVAALPAQLEATYAEFIRDYEECYPDSAILRLVKDLKACADALSTARQADGWRDIASAPTDGTEILLWGSQGADIGHWMHGAPDERESGVIVEAGMDEGFYGCKCYWPSDPATHWQPLPSAPRAQPEETPE